MQGLANSHEAKLEAGVASDYTRRVIYANGFVEEYYGK
jgi:hypothetical protein